MLMNYIALETDRPIKIHVTDDYVVDRSIADNVRGGLKRVKSLVFQVDELDGESVSRTFSILSDKLAAKFQPYLRDRAYRNFDFRITKTGIDLATNFIVEALPRAQA